MADRTAWLFPGQGSQVVGMGRDLFDEFGYVRELFDVAEEIAHMNLRRLCFEGPPEELTLTHHLQPALTVVNLATLAVLRQAGLNAEVHAGHSLGEFSALCGAGYLALADTIALVHRRGHLMHREAIKHRGVMQAVIGLTFEQIQELVDRYGDQRVVAANHNMEKQVVISGEPAPVARVAEKATSLGARAIPLNVSGAWHSHLMKGAAAEFSTALSDVVFQTTGQAVALNVSGTVTTDAEAIKTAMAVQLISPVRWYDICLNLNAGGVTTYIEIGPGRVLTGMLKKNIPKSAAARYYSTGSLQEIDQCLAALT